MENKKLFKKAKKDFVSRRSMSETIVFIVAAVILWAFALSYVFAFIWGVLAGLKTHTELILSPFTLPKKWRFVNYIDAFELLEIKGVGMLGMIGNTLWLVAGGTIGNVMGAVLMAYAVTKYDFWGKKALITLNLLIMIIPIIGSLPSQYAIYNALGLYDSPWILWAYIGGFGAFNLYMSSFFRGVSWTYAEAAQMDGAGHYTILFKIMLPLSKGMITALIVMQAVSIWNDSMTALLFLPNYPTLATGIYLFNTEMTYRARMDILMASCMLSAIPPLIVYLFGYKTILDNVSLGGIKG